MKKSIKILLTQAIQQAPSPDNSQPWKIDWQNNTLSLLYDSERVSKQTFSADSPATLLSMGAAIENLNQAAKSYNIQISPLPLEPFDHSIPTYYSVMISAPNSIVKISDTPIPLFLRHTNRLPFLDKPLPKLHINELKKLSLNSLNVKVIESKGIIIETSRLVRSASEIRFRTREIHDWLGKSFRFGKQAKKTNDGLDIATLDLPPGGSLFLRFISDWQRMKCLNKLGAYKLMSLIDSTPVKHSPALIAITGKQGFDKSLSAGQLMQRIWIDLNAQGIAVHPYYVISDQMTRYQNGAVPKNLEMQAKQVTSKAISLFELNEGETLHMLFRIGYPKKNATCSRRLPLEIISNCLQ